MIEHLCIFIAVKIGFKTIFVLEENDTTTESSQSLNKFNEQFRSPLFGSVISVKMKEGFVSVIFSFLREDEEEKLGQQRGSVPVSIFLDLLRLKSYGRTYFRKLLARKRHYYVTALPMGAPSTNTPVGMTKFEFQLCIHSVVTPRQELFSQGRPRRRHMTLIWTNRTSHWSK